MSANSKFPDVSRRWHMKKDGRTYIKYGPECSVREWAARNGYTDVQESGYYDYATNTVQDSQDGPVSYIDLRTGGKS